MEQYAIRTDSRNPRNDELITKKPNITNLIQSRLK